MYEQALEQHYEAHEQRNADVEERMKREYWQQLRILSDICGDNFVPALRAFIRMKALEHAIRPQPTHDSEVF